MWKRLYSKASTAERGTMFQLRNLINRSAVSPNPDKNMKASEDFLLLLLNAHVVAAAKKLCEYDMNITSVQWAAKSIINTYLLLPTSSAVQDGITMYARELLTLGLIWLEFYDAVREADGDRILLSWKIMLPIFKATNHTNYLKEAVNLLVQVNVFSPRKAGQLLWSRCVNMHGRTGCNIPCDLHQEHLNRRLKGVLQGLGANITTGPIVRAGKSLAIVDKVCSSFEQQTSMKGAESGVHHAPAFGKDLSRVIAVLMEEDVFEPMSRSHTSFTFQEGLLQCKSASDDEVEKKIRILIDTILD